MGAMAARKAARRTIDQLARTGVRVENCYTPPVCGPSRIVLLTGRYPHSTGFRLHHDAALYSGGGLDPKREIVFPRLLRDAGYATGITGKWQINNLYDEPDALTQHGFQESAGVAGEHRFRAARCGERGNGSTTSSAAQSYEEAVAFNEHIESRYWDPVLHPQWEAGGAQGPVRAGCFAGVCVRFSAAASGAGRSSCICRWC